MQLSSLPLALLTLLPLAAVQAQVSTITLSAAPQATSTQYTKDSDFQQSIIAAHNFYRSEHNASALTWNDTSAKYATDWSDNCDFKHSGGPTGENLAAGYANASASVDAWGLERKDFDFNKPDFSESTGHFTQVVWKSTTSVGCGRKQCDGDGNPATPGWYVVCEYYPPGNVIGSFDTQVGKQINGSPTDTVESGVKSDGAGMSCDFFGMVGVLGLGMVVAWLL